MQGRKLSRWTAIAGAVAAVTSVVAITATTSAPAAAAPGDVDPTFGTGGSTAIPGGAAQGVVTNGTGLAWATTVDLAASTPSVSVTRLRTDGRVDPAFGTAGTTTAERRGLADAADVRVAVDPTGRVVLASIEEDRAQLHLVVRRLLADGTPDPAFGTDGAATPAALPSTIADVASVTDVLVLPSGEIVVGVVSTTVDVNAATSRHLGAIARYATDGSSTGGTFLAGTDEPRVNGFPLDRLAAGTDGSIYHAAGRNGRVEVRRFDAALAADPTFGTGGVATVARPAGSGIDTATRAVVLRPTAAGVYVAADHGRPATDPATLETTGTSLARLRADGTTDPAWASGGPLPLDTGGPAQLVDVAPVGDGDVLVVRRGSTPYGPGIVQQFRGDGTAQTLLGGTGTATIANHGPTGPVVVDAGRLLLAGATPGGTAVQAHQLAAPALPAAPAAPRVLGSGAGAVTVTWTAPTSGLPITGYVVTVLEDGTPVRSEPATGRILQLDGLDAATPYTFTVAAVSAAGRGPASPPSRTITLAPGDDGPGAVFVPIDSCRVLDTRRAGPRLGRTIRPVAVRAADQIGTQGGEAGGCGIPGSATAVVAAVSAVNPSAPGFLRVGAGAETAPPTTMLTFSDASVTNVGTLTLGEGPTDLGLRSMGAATDVVIDVLGFFTPRLDVSADEGSVFVPITPCRVFDDRVAGAPVASGVTRTVALNGNLATQGGNASGCGIPDGVSAVEAALSSVNPTKSGFARLGPAGTMPRATVLNVTGGRSAASTSIVEAGTVGTAPALDLRVSSIRSSWVVDVTGYYLPRATAGGAGSVYHPAAPCRLADTRRAAGPVGAGKRIRVQVTGTGPAFAAQGGTAGGCAVPSTATAASVTVSAADALGAGQTRVGPAYLATTGATLVHFRRAASSSGAGSIGLGNGAIDVRTYGGPTNQVVDLQGWFE